MLFAFASIATVVVLAGLALRALIDGVAEHLEADDVRPRLPRPAHRLVPARVPVRSMRRRPVSATVTTRQYSPATVSHR